MLLTASALQTDLTMVMRVMIAFILGGLIGWERERHGISAGIRTYGAIALGSCVFGVVSISIPNTDPGRVAAQVVTGVGFLGGGIIFRQTGHYIHGLTTAASLWATSAVGLAVSLGLYFISFLSALLILFLLYLPHVPWWKKISGKSARQASKED